MAYFHKFVAKSTIIGQLYISVIARTSIVKLYLNSFDVNVTELINFYLCSIKIGYSTMNLLVSGYSCPNFSNTLQLSTFLKSNIYAVYTFLCCNTHFYSFNKIREHEITKLLS